MTKDELSDEIATAVEKAIARGVDPDDIETVLRGTLTTVEEIRALREQGGFDA